MSGDDALEREFEDRLRESSSLAFRVAYGVLRHRQDAEDVAQEAFARAHRAFAQLRDRERFRAWLVRMTWRLAIDHQRSHRRRVAREQDVEVLAPRPTAEQQVLASERARYLWQAIDALPEKLRVVMVMAGIEEYDVKAVAKLLDLPEGTVKSRLFLARKDLAERLRWLVKDSPSN